MIKAPVLKCTSLNFDQLPVAQWSAPNKKQVILDAKELHESILPHQGL